MSFTSHPLCLPESEFIAARFPASRVEANILSLGNDERLLQTRAGVLRLTGCEVISTSPARAARLLAEKRFSLAVFGHTLPDRDTAELALLTRERSPKTKLLLTYFDNRPAALQQLFDAVVESWTGPASLLRAAKRLLASDGAEPAWTLHQ